MIAASAETGDAAARRSLPRPSWGDIARARNEWRRAVVEAPDDPVVLPGFADDPMYRAYTALARDDSLDAPEAFRLAYDGFTLPWLYRAYCDDEPAPPGINVFDLHRYRFVRGRPEDYRSERKGPRGGARPIGSRFGPQNMAASGWALVEMSRRPDLWEEARRHLRIPDFFPTPVRLARPMRRAPEAEALRFDGPPDEPVSGDEVRRALEWELGMGLRVWAAVFDEYGYIPTGIGCPSALPGVPFDEFSDAGGYAHLIHAAARWIECLERTLIP